MLEETHGDDAQLQLPVEITRMPFEKMPDCLLSSKQIDKKITYRSGSVTKEHYARKFLCFHVDALLVNPHRTQCNFNRLT